MSRRTYLSTVLSTPMPDHWGYSSSMFLECAADGVFGGSGPASIDISELKPGDVTVIARPNDSEDYAGTGQTQFIAAMRKDKDYLIVELTCPHKGKAIGLTGDPNVPFACTKRGRYHSSEFDSNGLGVAGKSSGDPMIIPKHKLSSSNGKVVLELA